jgi:uncharacterized protein with FMN-binding domain
MIYREKETLMQRHQSRQGFDLGRAVKKLFLSGFVVFAFIAYVIHERLTNPYASLTAARLTSINAANSDQSSPLASAPLPANSSSLAAGPLQATSSLGASAPLPTDTPQPLPNSPAGSRGFYKDGTYKGPEIDAYYGLVQVQATIQSGKIANVQFLEYPSDRRTSVEINNIAVPYLQQEALQAQSASVDIISGATLTSEAFMMSLQNALNSAKN